MQESRIAASGIDRYMDGIYISEKVGAAKPSAKLFEHAFRDLGITNKSRVLMVGDDLLADIKGGLNAVWIPAGSTPAILKTSPASRPNIR